MNQVSLRPFFFGLCIAGLTFFLPPAASAQDWIVALRSDGLIYSLDPASGLTDFVNNSADYGDSQPVAICSGPGALYTLTHQEGDNSYRVSSTLFPETISSLEELRVDGVRSVVKFRSPGEIVDFIHDGQDFYFLGKNGIVYVNNGQLAYDFSDRFSGENPRFTSLACIPGTDQLLLGVQTSKGLYILKSGGGEPELVSETASGDGKFQIAVGVVDGIERIWFIRPDGYVFEGKDSEANQRGYFGEDVSFGIAADGSGTALFGLARNSGMSWLGSKSKLGADPEITSYLTVGMNTPYLDATAIHRK